MSSRFDTRAIGHPPTNPTTGKADVADRPSLKAFQAEMEKTKNEQGRTREPSTPSTAVGAETIGLEDKVKQLSVQEVDGTATEDDGRTLVSQFSSLFLSLSFVSSPCPPLLQLERLTNPDETSSTAFTSLIDRALNKAHGEIVVELGPHSLSHKSLAAIFDRPDPTSKLSPTEVYLPRQQVDRIVSTFRTILSDINASVSILHNPFSEDGRVSIERKKLTETESSQNDETTTQRWSGKSLRLMLRRKPDGAENLLETRVAVVGNVVSSRFS